MKKILVAVDYSPSAQRVAEQAHVLAKSMNTSMVIVHVLNDVMYYSSSTYDPIMGFGGFVNDDFLTENSKQKVVDEAYRFLEKIKIHLGDSTIETEVLHGEISDSILSASKKRNCGMVVIGTHSRNKIEALFVGSTAHLMLKYSRIPVVVVPIKFKPIKGSDLLQKE